MRNAAEVVDSTRQPQERTVESVDAVPGAGRDDAAAWERRSRRHAVEKRHVSRFGRRRRQRRGDGGVVADGNSAIRSAISETFVVVEMRVAVSVGGKTDAASSAE